MQVATITMPKSEAMQAYREYRKVLDRGDDTPEDQAIMMGCKAMAKGHALIDVAEAIRAGGLNEQHLPRLAIARASWEWVSFASNWRHEPRFYRWPSPNRGPSPKIILPMHSVPSEATNAPHNVRAMVPLIPPSVRPKQDQLSHYHILWEADWQQAPPTDPFLLRHLRGTLYVVLAVWDLTPLERAVMGARLHTDR